MFITSHNSFDTYLNAAYTQTTINAKVLSDALKQNLINKGINYNDYVISGWRKEVIDTEVYEYQNFFILNTGTDYLLLDGFRRLLWSEPPNHSINVRIYDRSELSDIQIIQLLIYLNHFKFYGSAGYYYDRGFALALKTIFGLDIPKYYKVFNGYLTLSETKKSYSTESISSDEQNSNVKERMLNPFFVSDMRFLQYLVGTGVMMNDIMGVLIYKFRVENPTFELDPVDFLNTVNNNKFIVELQKKYLKAGDGGGADSQKVINQLVPLYQAILDSYVGKEIELTYTEKLAITKNIVAKLKKDKSLVKLTGSQKSWVLNKILTNRLENNVPIKFVCVVHPLSDDLSGFSSYRNNDRVIIPHGILEEEIKFIKINRRLMGWMDLYFGFRTKDGVEMRIGHNYGDRYGTGKKYTTISGGGTPQTTYTIDLFADITQEEIEEINKN